ncbi:MAG: hypothetical protein HYX41_00465 [Bdellovibrio sp.]|nr:hypothetical protein [Bdellovibrio sp.]
MKNFFPAVGIVGILVGLTAFAGPLEKFDYPELTVVPRASERLRQEAEDEPAHRWTTYLPIQISGVATVAAGIATYDAALPGQSILGIGIGAGWLILTGVLSSTYRPYTTGTERVGQMPKSTMREQLAMERAAEEELHNAYVAGERMRWLSIATQLGASAVMLAKGSPGGFSVTQGFQVGAAVLSLAPLIFPFHWRTVHSDQMEYKKRIYGPVARPTLLWDRIAQRLAPGVEVSLRF